MTTREPRVSLIKETADPNRLRFEYFRYGTDYYLTGRFAYYSHALPVACNLFHHAVEMFMKGRLCATTTEAERKKLHHNLPRIFEKLAAPELAEFETMIRDLDAFEKLRYPEELLLGTTILIDAKADPPEEREFRLESIEVVDRFVVAIHKLASVNPRAMALRLKADERRYLTMHNRYAQTWERISDTEAGDLRDVEALDRLLTEVAEKNRTQPK